jgi:hypothetical protein
MSVKRKVTVPVGRALMRRLRGARMDSQQSLATFGVEASRLLRVRDLSGSA